MRAYEEEEDISLDTTTGTRGSEEEDSVSSQRL
jgi:hypothetical protein